MSSDTKRVDTVSAITKLFNPKSVVIVGASGDASKTSGRPVAYLQKHGYSGLIYPVNPKATQVGNLACYPSISAIPEVPDIAIILLGAERAHVAVTELADRGTAAAIVLASGYAETGEEGARKQLQLSEAAGSMRILGPNTIGLVNLSDGIVLSASGALEMNRFRVGNIGVVSQSGGILGSLLSRAAARGIGLSKLISTSNEMDLGLADFIDALVDDDHTEVIALYVEAVRHPDKFRLAALRAAKAGKPIVAFKIGRSEAGANAAVSHTGAMAGSDQMYDAFFKQLGIIRAQTFGNLIDVASALATRRVLRGNRVAILTSTGGAGTLVSDSLGVAGFLTPPPDVQTAAALRALQTGDHAALDRNPIDVTLAGLQPDLLRSAIKILLASPSYDALTIIAGSSSIEMPKLMSGAIKACLPNSDKPVIAYVSPHAPVATEMLNQAGVPAFSDAESCTAALSAMLQSRQFFETLVNQVTLGLNTAAGLVNDQKLSDSEILNELDFGAKGSLNEAQAKLLFSRFGINCADERIIKTAEQAEQAAKDLGGRVVLKLLSNEVTHKSDVGGVAVGVLPDQIAARLQTMTKEIESKTSVKPTEFLVQAMVSGGTEMILGLRQDALGTAVLLGMGGVNAEIFNDTCLRLLTPDVGLSHSEALSMATELKTWPLLNGYRGRAVADVDALVDAVVAFSWMAVRLKGRLIEAEINPLFVLKRGLGVVAADGVAVLAAQNGLSDGETQKN
jgi:acetate---CoA ligase (ADP-forming)